jgi:peptidoglycan LD-endopeptidase LytH
MANQVLQNYASQLNFSDFQFAPVIDLPEGYEIYDFSSGYDPERPRASDYGIGRYNERRPGMYQAGLFSPQDQGLARDIHVGIDIAAPVGTRVRAFFAGRVHKVGVNSAPGDYGGTIITEHQVGEVSLWALYGHLSHRSTQLLAPGDSFAAGEVMGWLGEKHENGGWNPHLHFQLSLVCPEACDMPGVVNEQQLASALQIYPDPRIVLGPLY